ncbi:MAG: hypothetical protein KAJ75_00090 [Alphaproteobacteria bacterium]|nr:hypothetical protein [Alphaproteobacteria bacterium]
MKQEVKIFEVPNGATQQQIEDGINGQLSKGWTLGFVLNQGSKVFIIFVRTLAQ